ncbi:hypothetical protein OIO90_001122 [Microbotryomycetes sp. JL221]|nr:hypothetical protein OIO90_001122 [Microbotryomycetes sp. JL221]
MLRTVLDRRLVRCTRQFATSARNNSKASKSRGKLPKLKPSTTRQSPAASQMLQDARGTAIGASSRLYEPEEVAPSNVGTTSRLETKPVTPDQIEQEMIDAQRSETKDTASPKAVDDRLRGTGAAASRRIYEPEEVDPTKQPATPNNASSYDNTSNRHNNASQEEAETIYTANAPYNVPLLMSAAFVFAVLSLSAADMARIGYSSYNEDKGEYEIAPKWKRYSIATGFGLVSVGIVSWGALAPARLVTQMTMLRPASTTASTNAVFPRDATLVLHSPMTKLPGLKPRRVKLSDIQLLGPLADGPRPYHPKTLPPSKPRNDPISRLYRKIRDSLFISSSSVKTKSPWARKGGFSHSPILITGDKTSYSLAIKRGMSGRPFDPKGAWCKDWDRLERALLGVPEK